MTDQALQTAILAWYAKNGRALPWRATTDPYAIVVAELMLQQTQVERVIPKYLAWLEQFPNFAVLAEAPTSAVIAAWSGLGYNRRALYLRAAAQAVVGLGTLPTTVAEFQKLPGIGPYTAAAIAAFTYNQDIALVDTNIKRFYQLLIFGDQTRPTDKAVLAIAEQYLPPSQSRDWHNALMDIGTVISRVRGAKTQQAVLVQLFPMLASWPLPNVSDEPLKRPKQSSFLGSRRYWRGWLIKLLTRSNQSTLKQLKTSLLGQQKLAIANDLEKILTDLIDDQLVAFDGHYYSLAK